MKKILKTLLYALFVLYSFVIFIPKTQIYYKLQRVLAEKNIFITQKNVQDLGIIFTLKDIKPYYGRLLVANIKTSKIFFGIFYNAVFVGDFNVNKDFKDFFSANIKNLRLSEWIFLPHIIFINGNGEFGKINGNINLYKHKILIKLKPQEEFLLKQKEILRMFKKTEDGYEYEQSF